MVNAGQNPPPRKTIPLMQPWFPDAYGDAVKAQVLSGFVGPGKATQEFAQGLAAFVGTAHCVLTTSGTVALSVAAVAVGLRPGDEILVPAYGVISTINAFAVLGLRPRLVDIDRRTGCMGADRLEAALRPETRAVCYVDFSGNTGPSLLKLQALCAQRGIALIEDAACALGHHYGAKAAGTFGRVGIYSFSVPKILTTGQGGAVITDDPAIYRQAAKYVDHGDLEWRQTNLNREVGTNLRFTDLQAALGLCQLRDIESRLRLCREGYQVLKQALGNLLYTVADNEAPLHNIVFTPEPDALVAKLRSRGVLAVRQYRTLSQHPAYAHLAGQRYPDADYWTDHAVFLPFGVGLAPADAHYVVDALHDCQPRLEPIADS